ncbi:hypothetical protein K470DRAFT_15169 [Piedraia hortae CBS 480.64]|uniref:HAUS augmin-like complex subunit 1 n=1 Tax=Piedraia hortae CBS 480.64 TaxID=1314780 RepID=A0A6A7C3R8_9PEZI|nr:hypothetical protein K470DRAFT_15169 [Piedraia hortae CBS 480.64]
METSFSPSKALAAHLQAQDWASVTTWLSKKYHPATPPVFERTEETLQALLTLANLNEKADELRHLTENVQMSTLRSASKAAASVLLGVQPQGLAPACVRLTNEVFELEGRVSRAEATQSALRSEQSNLEAIISGLDAFPSYAELHEKATEWGKSTKVVRAKVGEYDSRLAVLKRDGSEGEVGEVWERMERVKALRKRLEGLEKRLAAFEALPPDPGAAGERIEQAREELRRVTRERDRSFEGLIK